LAAIAKLNFINPRRGLFSDVRQVKDDAVQPRVIVKDCSEKAGVATSQVNDLSKTKTITGQAADLYILVWFAIASSKAFACSEF
jgi:hypothetical protein